MNKLAKYDPLFLFVNNFLCKEIHKKINQDEDEDRKIDNRDFVEQNSNKHRKVLWMNVIFGFFVFIGLSQNTNTDYGVLISALIAPAFITGGAWFAITFGGIPARLLDIAVDITFWMFSAFTVSLTTMIIAISFVVNFWILIVFIFIIFGVVVASILYDNVDGLKIGLDDALLRNNLSQLHTLIQDDKISHLPKSMEEIEELLKNKLDESKE